MFKQSFLFKYPSVLPSFILSILLFTLLLTLSNREDYWADEGFTLRRIECSWEQLYYPFALRPKGAVDPFDRRFVYDFNPPLYFMLIRTLSGPAPGKMIVRLYSVIPSILGLLFLAAWGRRILGHRAALRMLLVGCTTPALIYYGHEARPYALPLALACCQIYFSHRFWLKPKALFLLNLLVSALGCLMHFAFVWWVIAQMLVFILLLLQLFMKRETGASSLKWRKAASLGLLGLIVGSLIAVGVMLPQREIFRLAQMAASRAFSIKMVMGALAQPLGGVGKSFLYPAAPFILQVLTMALFIAMMIHARRRRLGLMILILWLVPLIFPLLAKCIQGSPFYERYAFFSLPGWLMALAWLFQEASEWRGWPRPLTQTIFLCLMINNIFWCAQNSRHPIRTPWKPIIQFLFEHSRPTDGYSIDPDWLNLGFAANARTRPPAKYFRGGSTILKASTLWVITGEPFNPLERLRLNPRFWRAQVVERSKYLALWKLTAQKAS